MIQTFHLVGIGEWLWNLLPGHAQTGGTPANVAFQAAAMAIGLFSGWDLDRINERSNAVASAVADQAGATPILPWEIRNLFKAETRN